ncbi:cell death-inducing p53-target protein 1-like [Notolabrus celidotus]|uniref:cell death-inducing p53-target protein 1-like n=1 Tax=Notolabrus celidotus TaxID=1203425 RepID=UPI00148FC4BA|nr:cell death-inducing p53-target protein 1-like [Notolabrus celidotus]XP_034567484.1 cell death-inducing p53-target protein 1-like [Notolabrus celidotus]
MTSSNSRVKQISEELKHISFKKHQLIEKRKLQCILEELRSRTQFEQTEEAASNHNEICSIDEELKKLTERKSELLKSLENNLDVQDKNHDKKDVSVPSGPETDPSSNIFFIESPPTFPAPKVYLDLDNLPMTPCKTQCPECCEFVVTETFTSISSITWMLCVMTACLGGLAGCCLIPFCLKSLKSTTHRCPLCRTSIQTVKKL